MLRRLRTSSSEATWAISYKNLHQQDILWWNFDRRQFPFIKLNFEILIGETPQIAFIFCYFCKNFFFLNKKVPSRFTYGLFNENFNETERHFWTKKKCVEGWAKSTKNIQWKRKCEKRKSSSTTTAFFILPRHIDPK